RVLLEDGVAGTGEDVDQRSLIQLIQDAEHRQTADELRDQTVLQQVLRFSLPQQFGVALCADRRDFGAVRIAFGDGLEAQRLLADAPRDDLFEADKGATADEQDVRRINNSELLVRMLASALRRNVGYSALKQLQKRLLHALAGNVAGNGGVLILAADLVDLVDVDDAALRTCHVTVGGLQQLQDDVLDVFADVAGFCQGSRIDDRKRDVEHLRQRLRHQGLARTCGSHEEDVRLRKLDVAGARTVHLDALVVVVNRYGQLLFRRVLTNDVLVQKGLYFGGLGQVSGSCAWLCLALIVFENGIADTDALITDIRARII